MKQIDHTKRLTAVRQKLDEWQVDGILITSEANRRWLSGFSGSNAQLLVSCESALIATDSRYIERAKIESPDFVLFQHERQPKDDRDFFQSIKANRIGIEKKHVTLQQAAKWQALGTDIEWVQLPKTVEPLRAIKTQEEMDIMGKAAAITDQAMSQFTEMARPGMSEKQLAWELEKVLREAGADDVAFPIIVASGPNSAIPHHAPGERPLEIGDAIIVDLGAQLNGYHSDLTRTFYLGNEPSAKFWEVYQLVHQANQNVFRHLKPGLTCREAYVLAQNVIVEGGYGDYFGHGLGHGVGLEIHEDPFMSPRAAEDEIILPGMNATVEPGIYIPGWGGVRIEDFASVNEKGLAHLSHSPKQPVIPF